MSLSCVLRWFRVLPALVLCGASSAGAAAPYANSTVITGINFNWATHIRLAPGSDNWPVTWADDDHQYASWGDGGGFGGTNSDGRVSLGFARIEGPRSGYTGYNVWGGKNPENPATFDGKCYGIISITGVLYAWRGPGSGTTSYNEARLYKSTNHSASWSATSVAFVKADDIVMPTILNFGKDCAGARDNYVYHYFIDLVGDPGSLNVMIPGSIYLLRVDKTQIENQSAYEFFSGTSSSPSWSSSLADRQPVFQDPAGVGWNLSVSHNAPLGRYLLCTEHTATSQGRLGMFDAPEPWGPWTTVIYAEGTNVYGAGQIETSTFFWNFSNKWLSADGLNFVMVFTGINTNDSWNTVEGSFTTVLPSPPDPATSPTPADGTTKISALPPMLGWTAGARAFSHDVYFGTANPPGAADFKGNQTAATFSTGMLDAHRTYYWRIDEVNSAGTTTGTVWRFTTRYGDHDGDGDVDQEDFGFFQGCMTGSGGVITPGCEEVDLDADEDVDVNDFDVFESCMGGPDSTPGC
jgi:hypothetical protein